MIEYSPIKLDENTFIENMHLSMLTQDEKSVIKRAKEILMRQRNLDSDESLHLLNEMAVKKNMTLLELSQQLVKITNALTT